MLHILLPATITCRGCFINGMYIVSLPSLPPLGIGMEAEIGVHLINAETISELGL